MKTLRRAHQWLMKEGLNSQDGKSCVPGWRPEGLIRRVKLGALIEGETCQSKRQNRVNLDQLMCRREHT